MTYQIYDSIVDHYKQWHGSSSINLFDIKVRTIKCIKYHSPHINRHYFIANIILSDLNIAILFIASITHNNNNNNIKRNYHIIHSTAIYIKVINAQTTIH